MQVILLGLDLRKTVFGVCKQQGADQPVHPCRLISAFVILVFERLTTSEISIFYLVSLAEDTGFHLALFEHLKTCFVASRPKSSHLHAQVSSVAGNLKLWQSHHQLN